MTASGCSATVNLSEYISVGELNSLDFTVDTTINCIKTDFNFNSFITTTPSFPDSSEINYFWDFTDGNSTEANPTFQYSSDTGYFDVLLVVDYRGCIDSLQIVLLFTLTLRYQNLRQTKPYIVILEASL